MLEAEAVLCGGGGGVSWILWMATTGPRWAVLSSHSRGLISRGIGEKERARAGWAGGGSIDIWTMCI